jgi:translation initiation factor IF-2
VRPQPRRLQQRSRDRTRELLREREQARERDLSQRGRVTDRDEELVLPARDEIAEIMEGSTVAEVAKALGIRTNLFMAQLFKMSILATINQTLDAETLALLEEPFQFVVTKRPTLEEQLVQKATEIQDDPASLVPRAPVVTIMGHVDHGKTSLLDAVRESNIAEHEAGSITQHIGAYDVRLPNGRVVFLDTPGHEAFTAMRARGARVTDVVVLVVAADDGVMPQTVEAINHARAAEVPIVVAVNKIDVPNANIERVRNQLARLELVPEEWGGKTIFAEISAKQRTGIAELLEYLALETDLLELKANPDRPAVATVIEAKLDKGRGPVATVLVQNGTLRVGDYFCAGVHHGRARALIGDRGQRIEEAGPSTPVEVLGIGGVPMAGDSFLVLEERDAISLAANRQRMAREQRMVTRPRVSLDELHRRIQEGSVKELNIILKADVEGSIEPILSALSRLHTSEVQVRVIHQGVGGISETDVMLAAASSAVIIGFNVRPTARAARLAAHEDVDVRTYDVIYTVVSDIRAALEGMLEPEMQEQVLGRATVRELFRVPRMGVIAGSYVNNGRIVRGSNVRVLRDNRVVHEGKVDSLRRFKDDVSEVAAGYECGIGVESFHDFKLDDVLECFTFERVARTLSLDESDDRSS